MSPRVIALHLREPYVYFTVGVNEFGSSDSYVGRVLMDGSAAPEVLDDTLLNPWDITTDEEYAYVVQPYDTEGLVRIPLAGGVPERLGEVTAVNRVRIVVDDLYLSGSNLMIGKMPKGGGALEVLHDQGHVRAMDANGVGVYWLDWPETDSHAFNYRVHAVGQVVTIDLGDFDEADVAVGRDHVFWTTTGWRSGNPGQLWRMPLVGGAPTLVTEMFDALESVTVHAGVVYFEARDIDAEIDAIFAVAEDCAP